MTISWSAALKMLESSNLQIKRRKRIRDGNNGISGVINVY